MFPAFPTPEPKSWMNKFSAVNPLDELTPEQRERAKTVWLAREAAKHSTGPKTEEGKRISSQNARKHGFAGANMVIDDEDKEAYAAHLASYEQSLLSQNQLEADTVRLAANAMWRIDRLTSIETGLFELEMSHHAPHIDATMQNLGMYHYMAIAFMENTRDAGCLELCRRYLSTAQRDFQRAIDTFYKLKENRVAVIPAKDESGENDDAPQPIRLVKTGPPNEPAPKPAETPARVPHVAGIRKLSRAERRKMRK